MRAPAPIPPVVKELLGHGVTVVVATRDAQLRPQIARAWGPEVIDDGDHLGACVEAPPRSKSDRQLTSGADIAVTLTRPSTYRSFQLKGIVLELSVPTTDQLRRVDEHYEAFAAEAELVGVSRRLVPRLLDRASLIQFRFAVHDCFDQTPGANAGARL